MKRHISILFCLLACLGLQAQTNTDELLKQKIESAKAAIQEWDAERMLDSLDQEKLPRRVTGGVLLNANMSNFIISNVNNKASSYMKIGGEIGGFLDFKVTKHFNILGKIVFTAEQNRFALDESRKLLWAFGVDVPVYFMGVFGNMEKGYLQFGVGPYTHITFASNIGDRYSNNTATTLVGENDPYSKIYVLHNNHSGLTATIGYEFPIGIQINAAYMVSLTDIFSYYNQETDPQNRAKSIYPQRVSLGIAYRWK